jgi:hypothetical protein
MNPDIIGWASSAILLWTVFRQVKKQWQAGRSEGVSSWLFLGQIAASSGFIIYSWMLDNWVFVVTNVLLLLSAAIGQVIYLHNREREKTTN